MILIFSLRILLSFLEWQWTIPKIGKRLFPNAEGSRLLLGTLRRHQHPVNSQMTIGARARGNPLRNTFIKLIKMRTGPQCVFKLDDLPKTLLQN